MKTDFDVWAGELKQHVASIEGLVQSMRGGLALVTKFDLEHFEHRIVAAIAKANEASDSDRETLDGLLARSEAITVKLEQLALQSAPTPQPSSDYAAHGTLAPWSPQTP